MLLFNTTGKGNETSRREEHRSNNLIHILLKNMILLTNIIYGKRILRKNKHQGNLSN